MSKSYSPTPSKTCPAVLDDETLLAIGEIITKFAEIENLINLYISGLAQLSESRTGVLLGRMSISGKIEKAGYLASMTGKMITEIHSNLFNSDFGDMLRCRNVMAHGHFLGKTEDGSFAFRTNQTLNPSDGEASYVVASYPKSEIIRTAKVLGEYIEHTIKLLNLQTSLDKQSLPFLKAHPKGRRQRKKSAKPNPPPHS
ncbi:MAG: hypothetical protein COB56_02035 [Robiginitomaculum sp.]|nr:MAG: hypothetical protein COB56_02035 [Robiginitomaculum sp.]